MTSTDGAESPKEPVAPTTDVAAADDNSKGENCKAEDKPLEDASAEKTVDAGAALRNALRQKPSGESHEAENRKLRNELSAVRKRLTASQRQLTGTVAALEKVLSSQEVPGGLIAICAAAYDECDEALKSDGTQWRGRRRRVRRSGLPAGKEIGGRASNVEKQRYSVAEPQAEEAAGSIRNELRNAKGPDELAKAIQNAENFGLNYEASLGKKKLEKLQGSSGGKTTDENNKAGAEPENVAAPKPAVATTAAE